MALLRIWIDGLAYAICGSIYNSEISFEVPSRVKRFSTASRARIATTVEVTSHDVLTQQFETAHLGFDKAAAMEADPPFPNLPARLRIVYKISLRASAPRRLVFQALAFLRARHAFSSSIRLRPAS
jgi:hypothetical protein